MDACPRGVDLTFHGIEAGRSRDLVYDESGATIPISYLLPIHPGSLFPRERFSTSASERESKHTCP